jgi:endoplasmic reticulum-Golgi intermediate compartment protein 2
MASEPESILDKLDAIAPIQRFDAFPKVQSTFRSGTTGGGFLTILVLLLSTLLVLNDFAEFMWGWPDSEFSVDDKIAQTMTLNADLVVNMPCHCE